jgi:hypothetical protein
MYVGNDLRRRTLDVTSETNRRTRPVSKNADRASGGQSYDCLDISGAHAGISKAVRYRYRIVDSLAASRSVTSNTCLNIGLRLVVESRVNVASTFA